MCVFYGCSLEMGAGESGVLREPEDIPVVAPHDIFARATARLLAASHAM